jgi:luciferase-type oxidoreductase
MDMSTALVYESSATSAVRFDFHPGYRRVFRQRELTVGLILPLETHPDSPQPTMRDHIAMARRAEDLGVAALWARDIPFYDPAYGDVGQIFDPLIYLTHLAAVTRTITLGTAGIVLPMREPLMLAKQLNSLDHLTEGRLIAGMSSGDRPSEYPVFGIDFETRGDRFREANVRSHTSLRATSASPPVPWTCFQSRHTAARPRLRSGVPNRRCRGSARTWTASSVSFPILMV